MTNELQSDSKRDPLEAELSTPSDANDRLKWWSLPARYLTRIDERMAGAARMDSRALDRAPGGQWLPWLAMVVIAAFSFFRFSITDVYTESLAFMIVGMLLGLLAPSLGVFFVACHVVFDLLASSSTFIAWSFPWDNPHGFGLFPWAIAGRFVSYWLLWLLVVEVPLAHRAVEQAVRQRADGRGGSVMATVCGASLTGALVYLWTFATPLLIRPVFTWTGRSPSVAAVSVLQESGDHLLFAAMISAVLASALRARLRSGGDATVGAADPVAGGRLLPRIRTLLTYVLVVFAMGGMISGTLDAVILLGALLASGPVASVLLRVNSIQGVLGRIPLALRFLLGAGMTFGVARLVTGLWFRPVAGSEFFPVVCSVAIGILIFGVLMRARQVPAGQKVAAGAGRKTSPRSSLLMVLQVIVYLLLVTPFVAHADNCSGWGDCFNSAGVAAAVAAGAAAAAAAAAAKSSGSPSSSPSPTPFPNTKQFVTPGTPQIKFDVGYDCDRGEARLVGRPLIPDYVKDFEVQLKKTKKGWEVWVKYKYKSTSDAPKYGEEEKWRDENDEIGKINC